MTEFFLKSSNTKLTGGPGVSVSKPRKMMSTHLVHFLPNPLNNQVFWGHSLHTQHIDFT